MRNLQFFIGKGGVGKTTVASAYAVWAATRAPARSVLLMSTDPAHSLADVFTLRVRGEKRRIELRGPGTLELWQIDADRRFRSFLGERRKAILSIIENGTFFRPWEIEPLLDTTLPGMAEMAALLALAGLLESGSYDEIVIDTAPLGHTLRLFEFPEHFARFLGFFDVVASQEQHTSQRTGGLRPEFLQEWRAAVQAIVAALSETARLALVTTPERFSLQESVRASTALADGSPPLRFHSIVLNRALVSPGPCRTCAEQCQRTREARRFLARHFPDLQVRIGEDTGSPVMSAAALQRFGEHVFGGAPLRLALEPPVAPEVRLVAAPWPHLETPLSLTIGKGGVGKTTISAGLAYHTRQMAPREPVTICSTDPAPSLDDIFRQPIGDRPVAVLGDRRLRAAELDAAAHFRAWAAEAQRRLANTKTSQTRLQDGQSSERRLFGALLDMVPPGLDELAATFRVLDMVEDGSGRALIDMAPTGHALELLRMPQRIENWARLLLKALTPHRIFARQVAARIEEVGRQARALAGLLKDSRRARIYPVMLPEPLPDRETGRLLRALSDLAVPTAPVFVNRVLAAEDAGQCARCALARRWQLATLAKIPRQYGPVFAVRNHSHEIAGASALKTFTRELWEMS